MAYIKPQSPIIMGTDHIYPLTTYDQIIMKNGERWDGKAIPETVFGTITQRKTTQVLATNWSDSVPYTQIIPLDYVKKEDYITIDINLENATTSNIEEYRNNWNLIDRIVVDDEMIVVYCYSEKPTIDLSINLQIVRQEIDSDLTFAEEVSF